MQLSGIVLANQVSVAPDTDTWLARLSIKTRVQRNVACKCTPYTNTTHINNTTTDKNKTVRDYTKRQNTIWRI